MDEIEYIKPRTETIDERNPHGVGRPSELTDDIFSKIKEAVLEGKTLRDIAKICEVSESTVYKWNHFNYDNFADKVEGWKRDRKVKIAEEFGERLMLMEEEDKDILRLKQKESEFVRETLGKKNYSKRSEMTGEDGGPMNVGVVYLPQKKDEQKRLETNE